MSIQSTGQLEIGANKLPSTTKLVAGAASVSHAECCPRSSGPASYQTLRLTGDHLAGATRARAAAAGSDLRSAVASRNGATKLPMPALSTEEDEPRVVNLPIKVTQQQQQQVTVWAADNQPCTLHYPVL